MSPATQVQNAVSYATMPTEDLVENFQKVWAEARDDIENDNLQTIEPMITSLVSRLIGKVESERFHQQGWYSGSQKPGDLNEALGQRVSQNPAQRT